MGSKVAHGRREDHQGIVDAVNDGRNFLVLRHPDARDDFAELLREMQATCGRAC